jgi:hypothetical protein
VSWKGAATGADCVFVCAASLQMNSCNHPPRPPTDHRQAKNLHAMVNELKAGLQQQQQQGSVDRHGGGGMRCGGMQMAADSRGYRGGGQQQQQARHQMVTTVRQTQAVIDIASPGNILGGGVKGGKGTNLDKFTCS